VCVPKGGAGVPYYSESEAKELREKIEDTVLTWPDVQKRMMFGSPSYAVGGTIFMMLVTGGIILTRLDEAGKGELLSGPDAGYFEGHGRVIKKWIRITIRDISAVDTWFPTIKSSYRNARAESATP
jgi:TfoX/Sxy family transcriptional regulator of competence genes